MAAKQARNLKFPGYVHLAAIFPIAAAIPPAMGGGRFLKYCYNKVML